jgi:PIN domain nuclease of toxin-antitoxin system
MIVYVLDSSALLQFIDDEAGSERVEEILKAGISGQRSNFCLPNKRRLHVTA